MRADIAGLGLCLSELEVHYGGCIRRGRRRKGKKDDGDSDKRLLLLTLSLDLSIMVCVLKDLALRVF